MAEEALARQREAEAAAKKEGGADEAPRKQNRAGCGNTTKYSRGAQEAARHTPHCPFQFYVLYTSPRLRPPNAPNDEVTQEILGRLKRRLFCV
jgi:hypothetical protein